MEIMNGGSTIVRLALFLLLTGAGKTFKGFYKIIFTEASTVDKENIYKLQ